MSDLRTYLGAALLAITAVLCALRPEGRWRRPVAAILAALAIWGLVDVAGARVHLGWLVVTDGELMGRWFPGVWKAHLFGVASFLLPVLQLALALVLALRPGRAQLALGIAGMALAVVLAFTRSSWPLAVPAFL
jgi:hypothetical protein